MIIMVRRKLILLVNFMLAICFFKTALAQAPCSTLFRVQVGTKWGYVNREGQTAIPAKFDVAHDFENGTAIVWLHKDVGIIDSGANWVLTPARRVIHPLSLGLYLVKANEEAYFLNQKGKRATRKFDDAGQFSEGFAPAKLDEKWGYIDESGEWVIRPRFDRASRFSDGIAIVQIEKSEFAINSVGTVIFEIDPNISVGSFAEGFAVTWNLRNEKYGYIDKSGYVAVPAQYRSARSFSFGLAAVETDSGWGFINTSGKMAIAAKFRDALDFHEGMAAVKSDNGLWGYVNRHGESLISPTFKSASNFECGVASVEDGTGFRYINRSGEYLF